MKSTVGVSQMAGSHTGPLPLSTCQVSGSYGTNFSGFLHKSVPDYSEDHTC